MATNPVPTAPVHGPKLDCEQEVRFAVVMYGGVSLAIYINGVAQELLSMVRATGPASADASTALPSSDHLGTGSCLRSSERVYRKVSYLLSNKDERMNEASQNKKRANEDAKLSPEEMRERWLKDAEDALTGGDRQGDPIRTRFIVDIISGTSAGGINGIFLAKALVGALMKKVLERQAESTRKKIKKPAFMPWLLVRTKKNIANLIGDRGDERRDVMEESTIGDYFFIAIYWLFYLAMSRILYVVASGSQSVVPFIGISVAQVALPVSIAAAVFGTVAAVSDIVENLRILRLLKMPLNDAIVALVAKLRHASTLKVLATCVTFLTLAFTFLCRAEVPSSVRWVSGVVGGCFILGSLVAAAGLIPRLHRILTMGFLIVAIGVLMLAIILMFAPGWFFAAAGR